MRTVKAWHLAGDFTDFHGGHLLVFAETAGKAKYLGLRSGPWYYDGFETIKCRRAPKFDGLFDKPTVIETNDDLPDGLEFYSDEEDADE